MVPRVANSHPWFSGPMEICRNHLRLFHHATFELHSLQGIDFSVAEPIDFQEKWPLKRGDPIPSRGWNNCFPHWNCHQLVSVPKWQIRRLWLRENTCSIVILCAMVPDNAQCLLTLETEITPKSSKSCQPRQASRNPIVPTFLRHMIGSMSPAGSCRHPVELPHDSFSSINRIYFTHHDHHRHSMGTSWTEAEENGRWINSSGTIRMDVKARLQGLDTE